MKTSQIVVKNKDLQKADFAKVGQIDPQIGFVFAPIETFKNDGFVQNLRQSNPSTKWVGCSTAGEVSDKGVTDNTTIITGLHFDNPQSKFKIELAKVPEAGQSEQAGMDIGNRLKADDLRSVVVISPGINVNGSSLVKGLYATLGENVIITGGLAGDGGKFEKTFTLSPEGVTDNHIVAVGFYGDSLQMRHGCMGGWDPFGKLRKVTKVDGNVLYELDGKPALEIYKEYLGDHAKDLPASGLMFPFELKNESNENRGLIRTILAVDEEAGSLTFAGDIPQGAEVKLMHANTSGLVSGAKTAAEQAVKNGLANEDAFAMIVSCVGRKLVMGPNVDEEIEAISEIFGKKCSLAGFYSYGEISPFVDGGCDLHNQTMTISYLHES